MKSEPIKLPLRVSIVELGLGNLFSVHQACTHVGMQAEITQDPDNLLKADAVILPGVGAFHDAMASLKKYNLVSVLHEIVENEIPLFGICLGLQLLMEESEEFGKHPGLGFLKGKVRRFPGYFAERSIKVPHVGWNQVRKTDACTIEKNTIINNINNNAYMYFVHSYYVEAQNPTEVIGTTAYGDIIFASVLQKNNLFGCQFHPERSGEKGLMIYRNFYEFSLNRKKECQTIPY